jgi:hypothetical protein
LLAHSASSTGSPTSLIHAPRIGPAQSAEAARSLALSPLWLTSRARCHLLLPFVFELDSSRWSSPPPRAVLASWRDPHVKANVNTEPLQPYRPHLNPNCKPTPLVDLAAARNPNSPCQHRRKLVDKLRVAISKSPSLLSLQFSLRLAYYVSPSCTGARRPPLGAARHPCLISVAKSRLGESVMISSFFSCLSRHQWCPECRKR